MSISDIEDNGLPKQWEYIKLGDIAGTQSGGTPSRRQSEFFDGNIPWVKSGELGDRVVTETEERITEFAIEKSSAKLFPVGTLCIALYGATVGKLGILGIEAATNQAVCGVFLPKEVKIWYAYYYLLSIRKQLIDLGKGGAQSNISSEIIKDIKFPIAPFNEQKRIVAKIEELFSKLDAGIAALERVQANLKRYRAAVLKAAVEGKLTEEWRKQNPNTEPASKLLQRILKERRQKWESEQLEKYQKSGKTPPKDWQSKYKEPSAPDISSLPSLPDGWCWASLGQLTWSVKDGPHYSPSYVKEGIPFITGGNVRPSGVDFDSAKRISIELHQELSKRCCPEKGDVLYTKGGTTGIARVNTYDIDFNVWVHVAVLKLLKLIDPFYIQHVLNSPFCYAQSQLYTHGVGNQDLGLTRMVNIVLSLPSINEQIEVVKQIDEAMGMIDHLETILNNNLKRASRLRQSILKQAFSGKLVPQDPNDEPASVLLQRIQAEKANTIKAKPAKRQQKRKVES